MTLLLSPRRVRIALAGFALLVGLARARANDPPATTAQPIVACGAPADGTRATLEARADEHFERGNTLYLEGQYEAAIREFEAVYCMIPVPEAAFNIAQAYLGLVDYEQATAWLELYVRLLPESAAEQRRSAENRAQRLRNLPARVRVASEPSGAKVVLRRQDAQEVPPIEGRAGDAEPLRAPAGSYVLEVSLPGYTAVRETVSLRIGQPYTYSFSLALEQGQVRITTEPFEARIFLDDKLVGVGTYVASVPAGTHQITVEAQGRAPRSESLVVRPDQLATLHVRLPAPRSSGRWELLGGAGLFGISAGATIGDSIADTDAAKVFLAASAAGVAIFGAYFGIPEDIGVGKSSFILGSAMWASIQSLSVSYLASFDDSTERAVLLGSISLTVIASSLASTGFELSEGDAALVNSGVLWGTGTSLVLWGLFDRADDLAGAYMLVGSNLGVLAGSALASRYEFSRGHVALIDLAGVSGMFMGLVLAEPVIARMESAAGDDTRLHFALGGTLVGLTVGGLLTRHLDDPKIPRALRSAGRPAMGAAIDASGAGVPTLGWAGEF